MMVLYLVQHAEAKREEEDLARPLSEKGVGDARRMAAYLSRLNLKVGRVFHSNKLRAEQTASIVLGQTRLTNIIAQTDGLAPLDDPLVWAERLRDRREDTMLVGHLPHLAKLAALLLCGDMSRNI